MAIQIDGSVLEGGGQILRSAVAFAAVLNKPVIVEKIRAKRDTPGLRPQHLHGILAVKELTDAKVKGTHVGSTKIEFTPQTRQGGPLSIEIGTAGATTLVLQSIMIVAPFCVQPVNATLSGGTNVAWSPPFEYLQSVLLPRLQQMNYQGELRLKKRGYYPRGGGSIFANLMPIHNLAPLLLKTNQENPKISGISHCGSLPRHVAERQADTAAHILSQARYAINTIKVEHIKDTASPGSGITLWAKNNAALLIGTDSLGRRGLRAEKVGEQVASALLKELNTHAPIDRHQADMLIPYIALAKGFSSIFVSELTLHTVTNIHVVEHFLPVKFDVKGKLGESAQISVKGIGLEGGLISPALS